MWRFMNALLCGALASACWFSFALAAPAVSQEWHDQDYDRQTKRESAVDPHRWEARDRQAADRPETEPPSDDADRQRRLRLRVRPREWIRIAIDINQDGTVDQVETIHADDLQDARERSRQRRQQMTRDRERRPDGRRQVLRIRVTGEIEDMRAVEFNGRPLVVGRVVTPLGRSMNVCLGPEDRIRRLDVREGDRLTVEGVRARLDGRTTLMARRITVDGHTVRIEPPPSLVAQWIRGEVVGTTTRDYRGRDGQYALARVRTADGRQRTVYLGRPDKVQQLDLQQGDRVSVLGRPGWIDGRTAFIADQVSAHGETVDVREAHRLFEAAYSAEDFWH